MIATPVPRVQTIVVPDTPQPTPAPHSDFAAQLARSQQIDSHSDDPYRDTSQTARETDAPSEGDAVKMQRHNDRSDTEDSASRSDAPNDSASSEDASAKDTAHKARREALAGDRGTQRRRSKTEARDSAVDDQQLAALAAMQSEASERPRGAQTASAVGSEELPKAVATAGRRQPADGDRTVAKKPATAATRGAGTAGTTASADSTTSGPIADTVATETVERGNDTKSFADPDVQRAAKHQDARVAAGEPAQEAAEPPTQSDNATAVSAAAEREVPTQNLRQSRRESSKIEVTRTAPSHSEPTEGTAPHAVREIVVDLARPTDGPAARTAAARNVAMAQTFARRLAGDVGAGVVRQANVLLSGSDRAEIKLIIRPPELGRVRIQLSVDGDHIAGRVLVDNGTVRQAIEQHLAQLQRSFAEAGLELGEFEVSSGGPDGRSAEDAGTESDNGTQPSTPAVAGGFESTSASVGDHGQTRINLVA